MSDFYIYLSNITLPMLNGMVITLSIFAVTIVCAIPLGFLFTLMVRSKIKAVNAFANAYIYVMRGTPLLLQLMFVYFGLPLLPFVGQFLVFGRFAAACIAFGMNYAAYFAEIFRGGLLAIDKGQYEAAKVLGLTKFETMTRVVIPQMIRVCLPSISNETITLVKDTALVTAIGVAEILHYAKTAVNRDGDTFAFLVAAILYLLINFVITMVFKKLETKYEF
ncbi:amino acid ABC transporter permease [Acetobacterium woodii]|uniref:Glutamine ABC transport system permease protein GlnP2 n=1 Tax=Acetobacterium woodii (strain ATCC 29683 / DSM 1030 / JCM 2381 / KCTC 1655 / WB1) TaxID=931626 RepID=H6LBV6_ACEWD|nr:amino acid ABC transporter permease [Acetobacterium woodii]AFA47699.1 glutamine ABC transport system permease protein GlnP2 [Acetobacterium woodii DSM 1030]